MKKLLLILFIIHCIARTAGAKENSFESGALYFQQKSHLSTWNSYKKLDDLSMPPERHSRGLPFALFDLNFHSTPQRLFYLRTPKNELSPLPYFHIKPEIGFECSRMKGESNAYHEYQASLGLRYRVGKWMILPTLSYSQNRYQATHPIFNSLRQEKAFRAILIAVWAQPFDLEDYFITSILAYGQTDANISFFDNEMKMSGVAIGYKF